MRYLAIVLLSVALAVTAAFGVDDDRVERLEGEVAEMRALIDELRLEASVAAKIGEIERRLEILAGEIETLRVGETEVLPESGSQSGVAPAASKVYRSTGGVSIGGYGEMFYTSFSDETESGDPSGATDIADALRGIVYLGYKFNDRFLFNSEMEFEHGSTDKKGSVSLEMAYIDAMIRPELNVRSGLLLVPMGFINEIHEPTTFLSIGRPLTESRIMPSTWRELGIGIWGDSGNLSYRSYLINGLDASGFSSAGLRGGRQKGSKAKAESLAWVSRLDWEPAPGVQLGASLYLGDSGQGIEALDGRELGVGTTIWEAHAAWRARGWSLRALLSEADVDDTEALNAAHDLGVAESLAGAYVELGYDLFSGRGRPGSLSPFIRWEQIDTQDVLSAGQPRDLRQDEEVTTVGLAWQPIDQLIFKLDWQDRSNEAGSGVDRLSLGLGYIF